MSVAFEIDASEAARLFDGAVDRLTGGATRDLMDALGALGAEQTKQRIATEKTSPDGAAWPASRNNPDTLHLEGHLLGSISHTASETETRWGSNLVYAAIHQTGGTIRPKNGKSLVFRAGNQLIFAREVNIPPRPYLGLSDENKSEITEAIGDWLEGVLQ